MYYIHNEQLFVNLATWHEIWAEYREFQVNLNEIFFFFWNLKIYFFFEIFSVKQVILIDLNVEVIQLYKKKNNVNI